MFYEYPLTIPAQTTESAPVETEVALAPGTVARVEVQFPRGCVGLVHVQIWRSEHQVWPSNIDGNISGDGANIPWPEDYDLDDEPYGFTLRGWNDDDSYAHTPTFRFALLPLVDREEATAHDSLLGRMAEFLGIGG